MEVFTVLSPLCFCLLSKHFVFLLIIFFLWLELNLSRVPIDKIFSSYDDTDLSIGVTELSTKGFEGYFHLFSFITG